MKQFYPKDAYSGAQFFVEVVNNSILVNKHILGDFEKTQISIDKQNNFNSCFIGSGIQLRSSQISSVKINKDNGSINVKIPFEFGLSGSSLLATGSIEEINILSEFLSYTLNNIAHAERGGLLDSHRMQDKIYEIIQKLKDTELKKVFQKHADILINDISKDEIYWPNSDICHGDLTLSNIIVNSNNNEIILIDFSSVYAENIIQDSAKLIQDVWYGWTNRYSTGVGKVRAKIISKFIWPHEVWALTPEWLKRSILCEVFVTLMRIGPYIKDDDNITKSWLINSIQEHQTVYQKYAR